jgi:CheY-like chemotaxis protein
VTQENGPSRFFIPGAKESMPTTTQKPRILVADDERVIADTLAMILNQSGFEARAIYSGEGALELAESFQPDMLISDVIMADLNGIDAAIRIRKLLPRIKILLFSGQAATADLLEKARKEGYEFDILAKPVHPQDLLARLRK